MDKRELTSRVSARDLVGMTTAIQNMNDRFDTFEENQNKLISQMQTIKQKEKRQLCKTIDNRLVDQGVRLDSLVVARDYTKGVLLVNGKYENLTLDSDLALMTDEGRIKTELLIIETIDQTKKVHSEWFL